MIVEGPIAFAALCEHHALPFTGAAHLAYVADEQIIGISKLTRLVRLFARRFTVQERLGEQIADALGELIEPRGVAVHLTASHLCTQMRGVEERSRTVTTHWRGAFEDAQLRNEFLAEVRATGLELLFEAEGPDWELPDGLGPVPRTGSGSRAGASSRTSSRRWTVWSRSPGSRARTA